MRERVAEALPFGFAARQADAHARAEQPPLSLEYHDSLTALDDALVEVLAAGDVRLVRSAWLLAQPAGYRIVQRQDLEALEARMKAAQRPSLLERVAGWFQPSVAATACCAPRRKAE